jgi:two-component system sensor histidine kinase ResE
LQQVVTATSEMPGGSVGFLKVEGPREVQELIRGFNGMSTRIKAAQQSQRQFVANVSHELKTPITIIQGFAQAMLDGTADTLESEKQAARVIFDESGRMHRLVVNLLDLARLDSGTFDLKHESVDVDLLLQHVVERFTPQSNKRRVIIEFSPSKLPLIYGDSDRLSQVFTNLLDNALKYSPEGGRIIIRAAVDTNRMRVDITDTGAGISSEQLPFIFDRFFQVDPSRKGGEQHSAGLGLAIVREIVQAHHGTITAQSSPGQGSTFTVRLPLALPDASTISQRRRH